MHRRQKSYATLALLWFLLPAAFAQAQNLLQNPNAENGTNQWRAYGDAVVAQHPEGKWSFVVRYGGSFHQEVTLPEDAIGKYALLIGRAASERINPDGAITGLPSLYGYMMEVNEPPRSKIKAYLQGGAMLCGATRENAWETVWGVFRVPPETGAIRFFLNQAERKGVPHNGSAARFNELGLYLFATEEEAKAFVKVFKEKH
jgi:hypothetical protein